MDISTKSLRTFLIALQLLEDNISMLDCCNQKNKNELTTLLTQLTKAFINLNNAYLLNYIRVFNRDIPRYKLIADNITTLKVFDVYLNDFNLKKPSDILFSTEYKEYSKEDIARIAYICGQQSGKNIII